MTVTLRHVGTYKGGGDPPPPRGELPRRCNAVATDFRARKYNGRYVVGYLGAKADLAEVKP